MRLGDGVLRSWPWWLGGLLVALSAAVIWLGLSSPGDIAGPARPPRRSGITAPRARPAASEPTVAPLDGAIAPLPLPDGPGRNDIMVAMDRVKARARDCLTNAPRSVTSVKMTILASGRVASAQADGELSSTETGRCLEAAARGAVFPPFRRPTISLTWPFASAGPPPSEEVPE